MAAGIQVNGLRELRRELKRVSADLPKELAQANHDAAEIVAAEARRRVPVRSGKLRGSVRSLRGQARGVVAAGRASVPYAGVTEFGGRIRRFHSSSKTRIPAQPYLYPALADKRDEVVEHYGDALDSLLHKAFPG
jgi:HK97 gp10 family phage protein